MIRELIVRFPLLVITLSLVCDDKTAEDLKRLQGNWQATMVVFDGKSFPDEAAPHFILNVKGDVITLYFAGKEMAKATNVFDATTTPKSFDQIVPKGKRKGQKDLGIYQLEGDTLTICIGDDTEGRPRDFGKKGGRFVMSFQRQTK